MISFESVDKNYKTNGVLNPVLKSVSFEVKEGMCLGIVGKSGEGKSTILRLINGLTSCDAGKIIVDGLEVSRASKLQLRMLRQKIGVVFQDYSLVSNLTVEENVILPLKFNKTQNVRSALEVLSFVGMKGYEGFYPSQLSGGQKQRVAIARALITMPKILLCDEITSALDDVIAQELLSVLMSVQKEFQMTIVYVTHRLQDLKVLADEILVIEDHKARAPIQNVQKSNNALEQGSYFDYVQEVMNHG